MRHGRDKMLSIPFSLKELDILGRLAKLLTKFNSVVKLNFIFCHELPTIIPTRSQTATNQLNHYRLTERTV